MKRLPYHQDTSLQDFEGEIWNDVPGYDGIYNVSNYGRVKSLRRYVGNKIIKDRILKQWISKMNNATVKLSIDGIKKTKLVVGLVSSVFLRAKNEGECVIHKNKIPYDNRLENLRIDTFTESSLLSYKLGVAQDWGIASVSKAYREKFESENIIEDQYGVRVICQKCFIEKPESEYYKDSSKTHHERMCKRCTLISCGVKDIGKLSNALELAKAGLRYCTICKELKNLDTDFCKSKNAFMGRSNNCRQCAKKINAKYNSKRPTKPNPA